MMATIILVQSHFSTSVVWLSCEVTLGRVHLDSSLPGHSAATSYLMDAEYLIHNLKWYVDGMRGRQWCTGAMQQRREEVQARPKLTSHLCRTIVWMKLLRRNITGTEYIMYVSSFEIFWDNLCGSWKMNNDIKCSIETNYWSYIVYKCMLVI